MVLPIISPIFAHPDPTTAPRRPTISEMILEWIDAIDFVSHPTRSLITLYSLIHILTLMTFLHFLVYHLSVTTAVFTLLTTVLLGTVYNTIWYHRFCSHAAFQFRNRQFGKFFLWTNPLILREESYAIPHRVHHQFSEKSGDPYGPHLGWLGSYLAAESSQKLNIEMSSKDYDRVLLGLKHISLPVNTYPQFKRTGSVEKISHYLIRLTVSQCLWATTLYIFLGFEFLMGWFSAIFCTTFLMRDFNWWGHGGNFRETKKKGWEFDKKSRALNQYFYGYLTGEWHDNHHNYPTSANNGFLPKQIDIAFLLIKLMKKLGIVKSYFDAQPSFARDYLRKSDTTS